MSQEFGKRGAVSRVSAPSDDVPSYVEQQWTGTQPSVTERMRSGDLKTTIAPSTPISDLAYSARNILKRMGLWL